jgi:hypothetical protein
LDEVFRLADEAIFVRPRRQGETVAAQRGGSLINNGVDHVDDSQFRLPVLLLGSFDGDAQASPHRHCLIGYFGKGLIMLAEKFFLYLEALIKTQQTHSDGSPRVVSSSPHVPVKLPAAK